MNRSILNGIFVMAAIVVASNILVQFLVGEWLTWGAFVYPVAFLVNDLMNRVYGPVAARKVVAAGFIIGLVCSLIGTQIAGEFGPLVTIRIALGSGTAYLVAQLLDLLIFEQLRSFTWWKAPLVSSVVGSTVDTFLFFSIAFSSMFVFLEPGNDVGWANLGVNLLGYGPICPYWVSLATADLLVKFSIALLMLTPFRIVSTRLLAKRV